MVMMSRVREVKKLTVWRRGRILEIVIWLKRLLLLSSLVSGTGECMQLNAQFDRIVAEEDYSTGQVAYRRIILPSGGPKP